MTGQNNVNSILQSSPGSVFTRTPVPKTKKQHVDKDQQSQLLQPTFTGNNDGGTNGVDTSQLNGGGGEAHASKRTSFAMGNNTNVQWPSSGLTPPRRGRVIPLTYAQGRTGAPTVYHAAGGEFLETNNQVGFVVYYP